MTEAYCNSLSQEIPAVTVAGKLSELLPFNHNLFSEDRQPISGGIAVKAQSPKTSFFKEDKPDNDDACNDTKPRRPTNERSLSLLESTAEDGN